MRDANLQYSFAPYQTMRSSGILQIPTGYQGYHTGSRLWLVHTAVGPGPGTGPRMVPMAYQAIFAPFLVPMSMHCETRKVSCSWSHSHWHNIVSGPIEALFTRTETEILPEIQPVKV